MKIVMDMSGIIWTCLSVGQDPLGFMSETEDGKPYYVNRAAYGYDNAVNSILQALAETHAFPVDIVAVFEGTNAKARRLMIDKDYKKGSGNRPMQAYEEFGILKGMLKDNLKALGAICLSQDGVESDDVIGWIAQNTKENIVIKANDNDLAVLSGTNEHGATVNTFIGKEMNRNKYGLFPHKFISVYKAMVGDSGDNIKGIPGFGPAAWLAFHKEFGEDGMAEMLRLGELGSLQELEAEAEGNAMVAKIYEGRQGFLKSYKLAKLHSEWVDTMQEALNWEPGMVLDTLPHPDARLDQWTTKRRLITGAKFDAFLAAFREQVTLRPELALDIETSTPPESDAWLEAQGDPDGVDVIGSTLSGMSLTFGPNKQFTVYMPVDHVNTDCVSKAQILQLLYVIQEAGVDVVIQNTSFEGTVLYNEFGEQLKDNGWHGFIANWRDSKFEAVYVNENEKSGLKQRAKLHLGYDQVDYNTVTTIEGKTGTLDSCGGKFRGTFLKTLVPAVMGQREETDGRITDFVIKPPVTESWDRWQLKMNQLSAAHVFSYATDDTIVTDALHNFYKFVMQLEGAYSVYEQVELKASYLHTQSFVHGTKISLAKLKEIEAEDEAAAEVALQTINEYLIKQGWEGTVCPQYDRMLTPAEIKQAHLIVTGEVLTTQFRLTEKIVALFAQAQPLLASAIRAADLGDYTTINTLLKSRFKAAPEFNVGSPAQKEKLFYEIMNLPVRVYNKATDIMKANGQKIGNPKTDNLAIAYCLQDADEEQSAVLEAMRVAQMVKTRKGLYYSPYPYFVHWKTGRVHASHNQCSTNTRRASESKPNRQQVSKHEKVEGYSPRVREVYVPHKRGALVVSMDFKAQELRVIADYSRDTNMLACYIGEHKKDLHHMTGLGIFNSRQELSWSYEEFAACLDDTAHPLYGPAKKSRGLGKTTNFTTEFGAAAPKLAQVLMVTEEDAQLYIDAKLAAMPMVADWKDEVIAEAKQKGYVCTKMGARRHLRSLLLSPDRYTSSKAERQSVNFKVQSSSAEMTKLAEGRMWDADLEQRFDCEIIGPIHDEVLVSVMIEDLHEFIPAMHACMVQPYGGMFVPIESSISFGKNFGEQVEIGDAPTKEAIDAGLAALELEVVK